MLMDALCRAEKMGDARKLLAKMKWEAVRPSVDIFNMLVRGYAYAGNVAGAEGILREMEGSGEWDCEALGIRPDATTFSTLMNMWADNPDQGGPEKVCPRSWRWVMAAAIHSQGTRLHAATHSTAVRLEVIGWRNSCEQLRRVGRNKG
jgi:pentatricopeptide repeat protein